MQRDLEQFTAECRRILDADPGPEGRRKVAELISEVLRDPEFVSTYIGDGTPARHLLYEDPKLGFKVLAHGYDSPRTAAPHDHGPTWAIYGQAAGETEMTEWEVVEPATDDKPGKVRPARVYTMTPASTQVYDEGVLHSPRLAENARLLRIEGANLDGVKRLSYEHV